MTSRWRTRLEGRRGAALVLRGLTLLPATPAFAKADQPGINDDDQIVLTGHLLVASDETVDTAAILNGDALIEGTVREDVFVVNGDTEVTGTVRGDVVVINGALTVRAG